MLYNDIINNAAQTHNVNPELIRAIIGVESSGRPSAISGKGASGLMQLMPATAEELGVTDRFDPKQNIYGGIKYLRRMLNQFDDNLILALAAYNAGPGNVRKYGGVPPFKETQNYVKKVMKQFNRNIAETERIHKNEIGQKVRISPMSR